MRQSQGARRGSWLRSQPPSPPPYPPEKSRARRPGGSCRRCSRRRGGASPVSSTGSVRRRRRRRSCGSAQLRRGAGFPLLSTLPEVRVARARFGEVAPSTCSKQALISNDSSSSNNLHPCALPRGIFSEGLSDDLRMEQSCSSALLPSEVSGSTLRSVEFCLPRKALHRTYMPNKKASLRLRAVLSNSVPPKLSLTPFPLSPPLSVRARRDSSIGQRLLVCQRLLAECHPPCS